MYDSIEIDKDLNVKYSRPTFAYSHADISEAMHVFGRFQFAFERYQNDWNAFWTWQTLREPIKRFRALRKSWRLLKETAAHLQFFEKLFDQTPARRIDNEQNS